MNIFKRIYNWLFVNTTINDQMDAHRADMLLLYYYRRQLRKERLKIKRH